MTKIRLKKNRHKGGRRIFLNAGMAQFMVVLNGILLSVVAFGIVMLFIQSMVKDEYRRSSEAAGDVFAEKVIMLENAMRVVSGILLLSDNPYRDSMPEQIRGNVAGLSSFDQVLWLFEIRPGHWQYRIIFESAMPSFERDSYKLLVTEELIAKIVNERFFDNESLRVIGNLPNMEFETDKKNPRQSHNPFAIIKVVEKGNTKRGILFGISRPSFLLDQSWISETGQVGRLHLLDVKNNKTLYSLDNTYTGHDQIDLKQDYSFFVGDSEWKISLEFVRKNNVALLNAIPYILLFFGMMLTAVGAMFVRNNHHQSKKLAAANGSLEVKNFELENEIAARERLNRTLEKTSKDNRSIIDSVSDSIFETDTDGKVLFLSAAWRKITGFNPDHSKGSELFSMLHPEEQDRQKQDFALLVSGQKSAYRNFARLRISDGTFRAVEIAISMIRQDENKTLRVVGTITDVEERRRAERALAEAEKKYRAIVENAAGGLYQITPEGMYLNANPAMARILGYSSIEELLRSIKNVNGTIYHDLQKRNQFLVDLTSSGQIYGYETQVLRKDGTLIWVSENVRVVHDEQQNILYFEGSMEDVTKRKEADIALQDAKIQSDMASRTKTEFIANISHELRTPLNAIIGFSEIMKDQVMGALGQDIYVDYAKDINKSGQDLLKIINEILDIAKIESGKRELREKEFSLSQVLESCLDLHAQKLKERKITLINRVEGLPKIIGEETAIKQVLGNIYSNAIKFSPQGGRITILSAINADGGCRITISDTGVGMTHSEIEKALQPFGQVENSLSRESGGTGLGLPLAKSMMELHGGQLDIASEKGVGTTVTIVFPQRRIVGQAQQTQGAFIRN